MGRATGALPRPPAIDWGVAVVAAPNWMAKCSKHCTKKGADGIWDDWPEKCPLIPKSVIDAMLRCLRPPAPEPPSRFGLDAAADPTPAASTPAAAPSDGTPAAEDEAAGEGPSAGYGEE